MGVRASTLEVQYFIASQELGASFQRYLKQEHVGGHWFGLYCGKYGVSSFWSMMCFLDEDGQNGGSL